MTPTDAESSKRPQSARRQVTYASTPLRQSFTPTQGFTPTKSYSGSSHRRQDRSSRAASPSTPVPLPKKRKLNFEDDDIGLDPDYEPEEEYPDLEQLQAPAFPIPQAPALPVPQAPALQIQQALALPVQVPLPDYVPATAELIFFQFEGPMPRMRTLANCNNVRRFYTNGVAAGLIGTNDHYPVLRVVLDGCFEGPENRTIVDEVDFAEMIQAIVNDPRWAHDRGAQCVVHISKQ